MQIEVTIKALFDPLDLAEHEAMADAIAQIMARPGSSALKVELPPDPLVAAEPAAAAAATPPPKRTRAAKGNGKAAPLQEDPFGDTGDTGDIGDIGDTGGAGLGLASPPAPADDPDFSDEALKGLALAKLRSVWAKPGGAEKVKALQKQYKLAKFADMPAERAAEVLAAANQLAQELGIRG